MDYPKTRQEIERRRLELQQKILEITLRQSQLEQELATVEQELGGLNQMQIGTEIAAGLRHAPARPVPGLTEHIRNVLASTQVPLTAKEIRDSCMAVGIRAASCRNLLIAVYTVLKRLGLGVKTVHQDGRLAYLPRPLLTSKPLRRGM